MVNDGDKWWLWYVIFIMLKGEYDLIICEGIYIVDEKVIMVK